jgi:hypothetical protein
MFLGMTDLSDFAGTRERWLAGACPCCGGPICEHEYRNEVTDPQLVAEGVTLCGRCIANEHHETDGFLELLVASLLPGFEACV